MSKFILSCTTCSLRGYGKDEIADCLEFAPAIGYKAWGIAGPPFWSLGGAAGYDGTPVRERAEAAGLILCSEVYGPQFPTDSTENAVAAAVPMSYMWDVADQFKSPIVVSTGGKRNGEEGLAASVEGIKALIPLIEGRNARYALEPHINSQYMVKSDFDYIFSHIDSDQIGITLDTGHFYTAGVDMIDFIKTFGKKIINLHLKDHIGSQSVAIGKGEINIKGIIKALHEVGFEGAIAMEMEVIDPENLPEYCKIAYDLIYDMVVEITGEPPCEPCCSCCCQEK